MANDRWLRLGLAGVWGGMAFLGWAPWGWWPALLMAIAGLFALVIAERQPLVAGALGLCFALTLNAGLYADLHAPLVNHMGVALLPALMINWLVLLGLALLTAIPCGLYTCLMARSQWAGHVGWPHAMLFASLWVLGELARAIIFPRMSFLSVGYALVDTWWAGFAPVIGSYGLGWLGVWSSSTLVCAWVGVNQNRTLVQSKSWVILLVALTGFVLQHQSWVEAEQSIFHVRWIESGMVDDNSTNAVSPAVKAANLVAEIVAAPADLIITSETAFPMYWHDIPVALVERLKNFADMTGSHLILGAPTMNEQFKGNNSMVFVTPRQPTLGLYNKVHLFPLGEHVPWGLGWLAQWVTVPRNDLLSGDSSQKPFQIFKNKAELNLGTVVCHEVLLSDASRYWAPRADVLINPANTAWFSQNLFAPQMLQIVRMRALEVGRPILHVSKTGGSVLISSSGHVVGQRVEAQDAGLNAQVVGARGLTPYVRVGDWPVVLLCVVVLLLVLLGGAFARGVAQVHGGQTP